MGKSNAHPCCSSEEASVSQSSRAAEHGVDVEAAIPEGMREKCRQFEALGGQIYHESLPDEP